MTPAAIALLEFESIAAGTRTADAMVKSSPLDVLRCGTVHPGKYLILIGGTVGAVEEARRAALAAGGEHVTTEVFLPDVHEQVYAALEGVRRDNDGDALAILETDSIPVNVAALDTAVKTARISVVELRLGDGLGGKAVATWSGLIHDVQAAMDAALDFAQRGGTALHHTVIPIQHEEVRSRVNASTRFAAGAAATTPEPAGAAPRRPATMPQPRKSPKRRK